MKPSGVKSGKYKPMPVELRERGEGGDRIDNVERNRIRVERRRREYSCDHAQMGKSFRKIRGLFGLLTIQKTLKYTELSQLKFFHL